MKRFHGSNRLLPFLPPLGEQVVRFIFVGGINTLVGYALYAVGVLLGLSPTVALFIATALGALFNFFSIGTYVFGQGGKHLILRFLGLYAGIYMLNLVLLHGLLGAGVGPLIAQAILVPLMATLSFVFNRKFVFTATHDTPDQQ